MNRLLIAEAFVIVVEEGSFTAAARRLRVTKSYASKLVRQLEEHLGLRLLHRTTRKLALTEPGRAYYERCAEIMRAMTNAEAEATQHQLTVRGLLRVTLPTAFCVPSLIQPITAFQARYPELTLDTVFIDRHVDLVSEGFDREVEGIDAQRMTVSGDDDGVGGQTRGASCCDLSRIAVGVQMYLGLAAERSFL